jgi:hypothetical protein
MGKFRFDVMTIILLGWQHFLMSDQGFLLKNLHHVRTSAVRLVDGLFFTLNNSNELFRKLVVNV